MEAEAKHNFVPQDPTTELAFNKGDKLLILNFGYQVDWYNATLNGKKGLVPGNYIDIDAKSWYLGQIPRSTAENLLQRNKNDGAFLVRISESSPDHFSLSVKSGDSVQHFRIMHDDNYKYFLWQSKFDSLNELVEHYRTETVSKSNRITLVDMGSDNQFIARAKYDFKPESEEGVAELGFSKGDLINVFDSQDHNWWGGSIGDRCGYFPATYVEEYDYGMNQDRPTDRKF